MVNSVARHPPQDVMSDLSKLPLLIKLLKVCPLPDLDIEGLLKNLRASILANISCLKKVPDHLLEFQSALALQCFVNEYIYDQTEDEEKTLKALSKAVKSALEKNQQPTPQVILTLASYNALYEYDWCDSLIITDDIRDVHNRMETCKRERSKVPGPLKSQTTYRQRCEHSTRKGHTQDGSI